MPEKSIKITEIIPVNEETSKDKKESQKGEGIKFSNQIRESLHPGETTHRNKPSLPEEKKSSGTTKVTPTEENEEVAPETNSLGSKLSDRKKSSIKSDNASLQEKLRPRVQIDKKEFSATRVSLTEQEEEKKEDEDRRYGYTPSSEISMALEQNLVKQFKQKEKETEEKEAATLKRKEDSDTKPKVPEGEVKKEEPMLQTAVLPMSKLLSQLDDESKNLPEPQEDMRTIDELRAKFFAADVHQEKKMSPKEGQEEKRTKQVVNVKSYHTRSPMESPRRISMDSDAEEEIVKKKLKFVPKDSDGGRFKSGGFRVEFRGQPQRCERYMSVEEYSKKFIESITNAATDKEEKIYRRSSMRIVEGFEYEEGGDDGSESLSESSTKTYVCVFEWPTIEKFTIQVGSGKIYEYLSYWKVVEDWKYCVNFLYGESDAACDFYRYEAIFSIPCKEYPIPQATASVYFTFEVSRVRPKHCVVDVYYCFEGHRFLHTPGKYLFQEQWLFNIVDAKIKFYKTLNF